jgi:hypothetical protein
MRKNKTVILVASVLGVNWLGVFAFSEGVTGTPVKHRYRFVGDQRVPQSAMVCPSPKRRAAKEKYIAPGKPMRYQAQPILALSML